MKKRQGLAWYEIPVNTYGYNIFPLKICEHSKKNWTITCFTEETAVTINTKTFVDIYAIDTGSTILARVARTFVYICINNKIVQWVIAFFSELNICRLTEEGSDFVEREANEDVFWGYEKHFQDSLSEHFQNRTDLVWCNEARSYLWSHLAGSHST